MKDGVEPAGQLVARRHLIRYARVANLRLGADDALSDSWRIHEKRAADFFGRQPAHFAQRQRHLRIQRQRRMATGENQPQPIVLDVIFTRLRGIKGTCGNPLRKLRQRCVVAGTPAHAVDRFEAAGRDEPRARVVGHTVAGPLLDGGCKGIVHRLFGAIEIAEQADERREHAPRVGAVDGIHRLPRALARKIAHRSISPRRRHDATTSL